jgi:hypothetical protein
MPEEGLNAGIVLLRTNRWYRTAKDRQRPCQYAYGGTNAGIVLLRIYRWHRTAKDRQESDRPTEGLNAGTVLLRNHR